MKEDPRQVLPAGVQPVCVTCGGNIWAVDEIDGELSCVMCGRPDNRYRVAVPKKVRWVP